jgi:diphthamide synthase (EF-2-diphthine--ammonia ligase)
MIEAGFRAFVVCVDSRALHPAFAGGAFDRGFLDDLPRDADPCGENGEFHTFICDAPMYRDSHHVSPGGEVVTE